MLRALPSATEAHEVLGPLVIQCLPLLAALKLPLEAALVTIQENLLYIPHSQRKDLLSAVEYLDNFLPQFSARCKVTPRKPPCPSKLYSILTKREKELFCGTLEGKIFDICNSARSGRFFDFLPHHRIYLLISLFLTAFRNPQDFPPLEPFFEAHFLSIILDASTRLKLPLSILRRSLEVVPCPVPCPLPDGQVFGPLPPSLVTSAAFRARYPPPPPLCTWPYCRSSLKRLMDCAATRILLQAIACEILIPPLSPTVPEGSRTPAAPSKPTLHLTVSLPSPFTNIGGPSRKSLSSFKPAPRSGGKRRRAITHRAFLLPLGSLSIRPRSRLPPCPSPFTSSPSSPHSPLSPVWVPAALRLKLGDVGWVTFPSPLTSVPGWDELPEFAQKLGDVRWFATLRPRPPRPDPP